MLYILFEQKVGYSIYDTRTSNVVKTKSQFKIKECQTGQKQDAIQHVVSGLGGYGYGLWSSYELDKFTRVLENVGIYDDKNNIHYKLLSVCDNYSSVDIINDNIDTYDDAITMDTYWDL